jgi:cytochrome c556
MRPVPLALLSVSLAGAAVAAGVTVKYEMTAVVDPAANTIFAVGGEVDPDSGPDAAKVTAARWQDALKAAQALKVVAADLLGPQKRPGDDWTKDATDFAKLAVDAEQAALKKDGAGLSAAANGLGDTCTTCHSKFKDQTGN